LVILTLEPVSVYCDLLAKLLNTPSINVILKPLSAAERSKSKVYGLSVVGITDSNPAGSMDVDLDTPRMRQPWRQRRTRRIKIKNKNVNKKYVT
jgi:hypothetical protein